MSKQKIIQVGLLNFQIEQNEPTIVDISVRWNFKNYKTQLHDADLSDEDDIAKWIENNWLAELSVMDLARCLAEHGKNSRSDIKNLNDVFVSMDKFQYWLDYTNINFIGTDEDGPTGYIYIYTVLNGKVHSNEFEYDQYDIDSLIANPKFKAWAKELNK